MKLELIDAQKHFHTIEDVAIIIKHGDKLFIYHNEGLNIEPLNAINECHLTLPKIKRVDNQIILPIKNGPTPN